jgi:hypothetical protein
MKTKYFWTLRPIFNNGWKIIGASIVDLRYQGKVNVGITVLLPTSSY